MARHPYRKKKAQAEEKRRLRLEADEIGTLPAAVQAYCADKYVTPSRARKSNNRGKKAFRDFVKATSNLNHDAFQVEAQRAKELRRTAIRETRRAKRSIRRAKADRRNRRAFGLAPNKMSYRIF